MRIIKSFNPARLSNRESVTFLMQVIESAKSVDSESEIKALTALDEKNNEFNKYLTQNNTVERTAQLQNVLANLSDAAFAIRLIAKAYTYSAEPAKKDSADKVLAVFAKYGSTHNLSIFEKVSKLRHIAADLAELDIDADVLPVTEFVDRIQTLPAEFNALYAERADFMGATLGRIAESRRAAEDAYRTFVIYANGLAVAEPEKYDAFVAQVNQIIAKASLMIPGRSNKQADTEVEPVSTEC